jgi:hypothetical protein
MTVSEFIDWLKGQDQEAIVECVCHGRIGSYYEQGGTATIEEFTPGLSDYTDFRGNQFVRPGDPSYNKRILLIGESE